MNSKWADYVITAVRYDSDYGYIAQVRVYEHNDNKLENRQHKSRDWVIAQLRLGKTFVTATQTSYGTWRKGEKVRMFKVNEQTYIRSDQNSIAKDNLENLSEF